jgi:hypothetical protein
MKALKILAILLAVYVAIVAIFESLIGYYQPENQSTQVLITSSPEGVSNPRVVARLESGGQLYVAANHWPRAWYRHALANPEVQVTFGDETLDYLAVPVEGAEHDQVDADNPLGPVFRFLTGYPPRYFVRLDPR